MVKLGVSLCDYDYTPPQKKKKSCKYATEYNNSIGIPIHILRHNNKVKLF